MVAMPKKCAAERLAPAQYLLLELLASYRALGENEVVLPGATLGIAKALQFQSLVDWKLHEDGIVVRLTPAGVKTVESDNP